MAGQPEMGKDKRGNSMQFASMRTAKSATITTSPAVFDALFDQYVELSNTSAAAIFFRVETASTVAAADVGGVVLAGQSKVIIVRAGLYIGSTANLHACAIGEAV